MVTFIGQFIDHMLVSTASNHLEAMPIAIPDDDPTFRNGSMKQLSFERSIRAVAMSENGAERAINSLSSAIDLAAVYGSGDVRAKALRTFTGGAMKVTAGDMMPLNTMNLVNAPNTSPHFFVAGDHRANEHPVLASLHTLFLREHNLLCKELKATFPLWDDERLYQMARKINGAQMQKIVYNEFYPAITGRRLPKYRGYNANVSPAVSDIFATAAFRVGHTLVGSKVTRRGEGMKEMPDVTMRDMFFRPASFLIQEGIEPFLRGAMYRRAQEVDQHVSSSLRNFLFSNVKEESGFDLVALNLQRGRDNALPSYNEIRRMFRRRPATKFSHITRNLAVQNVLSSVYKEPKHVEAWVGLMCEDHVPGASMGRTLLRIWRAEFMRLRDGDRFFYRRWSLFDKELWHKFPRLRHIMFEHNTLKKIILRNTNIKKHEIRGSIWRGRDM